ncbi:MAG TPA: hypothetical protein VFE50_02290, partial [Cyclobacteriaceae bacterium]|nr:hypothetical protein [Cyclobacteriaceae bacterium]
MKKIVVLTALLLAGDVVEAQVSLFDVLYFAARGSVNRKQEARVKLIYWNGSSIKGHLYSMTDTTVSVFPIRQRQLPVSTFSLKEIKAIGVRRKNSIRRGSNIGAVVGLVSTGLVVYSTYEGHGPKPEADRGSAAAFGAMFGLLIGEGVGALCGTLYRSIEINGMPTEQQIETL